MYSLFRCYLNQITLRHRYFVNKYFLSNLIYFVLHTVKLLSQDYCTPYFNLVLKSTYFNFYMYIKKTTHTSHSWGILRSYDKIMVMSVLD